MPNLYYLKINVVFRECEKKSCFALPLLDYIPVSGPWSSRFILTTIWLWLSGVEILYIIGASIFFTPSGIGLIFRYFPECWKISSRCIWESITKYKIKKAENIVVLQILHFFVWKRPLSFTGYCPIQVDMNSFNRISIVNNNFFLVSISTWSAPSSKVLEVLMSLPKESSWFPSRFHLSPDVTIPGIGLPSGIKPTLELEILRSMQTYIIFRVLDIRISGTIGLIPLLELICVWNIKSYPVLGSFILCFPWSMNQVKEEEETRNTGLKFSSRLRGRSFSTRQSVSRFAKIWSRRPVFSTKTKTRSINPIYWEAQSSFNALEKSVKSWSGVEMTLHSGWDLKKKR